MLLRNERRIRWWRLRFDTVNSFFWICICKVEKMPISRKIDLLPPITGSNFDLGSTTLHQSRVLIESNGVVHKLRYVFFTISWPLSSPCLRWSYASPRSPLPIVTLMKIVTWKNSVLMAILNRNKLESAGTLAPLVGKMAFLSGA